MNARFPTWTMISFGRLLAVLLSATPIIAFVPQHGQTFSVNGVAATSLSISPLCRTGRPEYLLWATPDGSNEDDEESEKPENPYADPNYPDLEFVNYDDPEYSADQGEEFVDEKTTEEEIEEMREDRRRRNDEYQFQTYFQKLLRDGKEYKGDWSVYQTSTFVDDLEEAVDANGFPRLLKSSHSLYVTSSATKSTVECDSPHPTDAERIYHKEILSERPETDGSEGASKAEKDANQAMLESLYWPEALSAFDFRGEKGIMMVGNAYTISSTVPLKQGSINDDDGPTEGPFAEYRAEMGLHYEDLRFRVKLDYCVKDDDRKEKYMNDNSATPPALCLKSMVICREALEQWPVGPDEENSSFSEQVMKNALYGKAGAEGGLYDPPPVGPDEQAGKYMMLDLEGGASLLFPHEMEQDPAAFEGNGWVTSLDWTPGTFRYQVDRKVQGGLAIRNLRTLELSEVQGAEADEYRPRDGGEDMRQ